MSDSKHRDTERRWKSTQDVQDYALFLNERVRQGNLVADRLLLAAHCGHPAALLATATAPRTQADTLAAWSMAAIGCCHASYLPLIGLIAHEAYLECQVGLSHSSAVEGAWVALNQLASCPCQSCASAAVAAGAAPLIAGTISYKDGLSAELYERTYEYAEVILQSATVAGGLIAGSASSADKQVLMDLLSACRWSAGTIARVRAQLADWALG